MICKISNSILYLLFCFLLQDLFFISSVNAKELPRFVSLGSDHVYGRSGPGKQYPIKWEYKRKNLPVEIIKEYEHWRKVKDPDGENIWIHKTLLSGARYGMISLKDNVEYDYMYGNSKMTNIIARLGRGLVVKIIKCESAICKVEYSGFDGWVKRKIIWGIYPHEKLN